MLNGVLKTVGADNFYRGDKKKNLETDIYKNSELYILKICSDPISGERSEITKRNYVKKIGNGTLIKKSLDNCEKSWSDILMFAERNLYLIYSMDGNHKLNWLVQAETRIGKPNQR